MKRSRRVASVLAIAWWAVLACDRGVEPYDPDEQPQRPDLSRIFPAGAERGPQPAAMPPAPGGRGGPRGAPPVASSAEPIRGRVTVAAGLADRVPAGATLFLIARTGSSGPPLAVKRIASPRLPMDFEIGPGDRMIASRPFVGPLQLTARLDADGNATTRTPGDLQGVAPGTYGPGDRDVSLVIDEAL
jgi:hypothetical protein